MENYQRAWHILELFREEYPKSLNEDGISSPKMSIAPFHPVVTKENSDAKVLRHLNEKTYCDWCENTIKRMSKAGYKVKASILNNKFIAIDTMPDAKQMNIMHIGHTKFYGMLKKALSLFSVICPPIIFNMMSKKAEYVLKKQ